MRRVNRNEVIEPKSLNKPFQDGATELDRAIEHYLEQQNKNSYSFDRYRGADVKKALDDIFFVKCAYCESFFAKTQPVDVEHYRPKGKIEGVENHRGYWWLAMDWENLLPSCIDCNRRRWQRLPDPSAHPSLVSLSSNADFVRGVRLKTGKQAAFPIASNSPRANWLQKEDTLPNLDLEKRLLLDPTRDNPEDSLVFHVDRSDPSNLVSIVYPKPFDDPQNLNLPDLALLERNQPFAAQQHEMMMGMVSIQVYGLNRLSLVQARSKMLRDLEFLLELNISLESLSDEIDNRIQANAVKIERATGLEKEKLQKDQNLDKKIASQLRQHADEALEKIKEMTRPEAEYSALAKAWLKKFIEE